MTKLRRAGMEPYWTETEISENGEERIIAGKYRLDWRQISILSKKKRKGNPTFGKEQTTSENAEQST